MKHSRLIRMTHSPFQRAHSNSTHHPHVLGCVHLVIYICAEAQGSHLNINTNNLISTITNYLHTILFTKPKSHLVVCLYLFLLLCLPWRYKSNVCENENENENVQPYVLAPRCLRLIQFVRLPGVFGK